MKKRAIVSNTLPTTHLENTFLTNTMITLIKNNF